LLALHELLLFNEEYDSMPFEYDEYEFKYKSLALAEKEFWPNWSIFDVHRENGIWLKDGLLFGFSCIVYKLDSYVVDEVDVVEGESFEWLKHSFLISTWFLFIIEA
jgi:hypothetical protein